MARPQANEPFSSLEKITTVFHVGIHKLRVSKVTEGRWTYAVDDGETSSTFATQAAAWEAGVNAADRLDTAAR